ncbi:MAG TPA: HAD-IIA family hydrolase [Streptosporangiaceae bacterium]
MPARAAEVSGLLASPQPLATVYDVVLTDLDGVVYLGTSAVPGAPEALEAAVAAGLRIVYVTNNASRTPSAIAAQLAALGLPARAADVVTSAQAGATLLAERVPAGSEVLVVGGTGLRWALRERGFRPVSVASGQTAAVIQGYAPDISYSLLTEGTLAVQGGALFVATNADRTMPTPRGRQPGNGALIAVIATATGREPLVAGKPEPPLHAEAVARSGARRPLVVGDRLDTDIEGAVRAGSDSLLVLTGVSRPLDAVLAPPQRRPSYLAEDLTGLLTPHPPVVGGGGGFRCRGWLARPARGQFVVEGAGERIDGLRALCAAAWSGSGPSAGAVTAALSQLGY